MHNKTVVITGASSGIGKALALAYSKEKVNLVLIARRKEKLDEIKSYCQTNGSSVKVIVADLSDEKAVEKTAQEALNAFNKVDILINNAGISQRGTIADTIFEVDRKVMELNYFSQIYLTKLLLSEIRKNKGQIVVISSLSGLFGFPLRSAYAASKHALHGFFETLQLEEKEISTTIVCPGRIKTDISLSAITASGEKHGKMDEGQLKGIDVNVCAQKIITAIGNRKKKIIIAKEEKILLFMYNYIKPLFYKIASKIKAT
jgi:short-subunit dehydrogenase